MKLDEISNFGPAWRIRYSVTQEPAQTRGPGVEFRTFGYDNGEREHMHAHEAAQMIYVTQGVLRVLTPSGIWMLPPFHALWLPPAILHELQSIGETQMRSAYVNIRPEQGLENWTTCRVVQVSDLLDALVKALCASSIDDADRRAEHAIPLFFLELARAPTILTGSLPLPEDRRLRALCEQLLSYPENTDTIELWSERVGASPRTIARVFREETGLSFAQWRQQLRLSEALARLALDVPITTIATELGYQSTSAFISMFKKTLGATPQRFLKRHETAW